MSDLQSVGSEGYFQTDEEMPSIMEIGTAGWFEGEAGPTPPPSTPGAASRSTATLAALGIFGMRKD